MVTRRSKAAGPPKRESSYRILLRPEPEGGYTVIVPSPSRPIPPHAKNNLRDALERLVQLYTAWDKPAEAAKWQTMLDAMPSAQQGK